MGVIKPHIIFLQVQKNIWHLFIEIIFKYFAAKIINKRQQMVCE
jgi:hypothetical protein